MRWETSKPTMLSKTKAKFKFRKPQLLGEYFYGNVFQKLI